MADQRAHPTAQTPAVLANRQAVVDLLNVQLKEAGCGTVAAPKPAAPVAAPVKTTPAEPAPATTAPAAGAGSGDVVGKGSPVTLSGEAGTAAASSGTFPVGTTDRGQVISRLIRPTARTKTTRRWIASPDGPRTYPSIHSQPS